jgi:hypothetical protein
LATSAFVILVANLAPVLAAVFAALAAAVAPVLVPAVATAKPTLVTASRTLNTWSEVFWAHASWLVAQPAPQVTG